MEFLKNNWYVILVIVIILFVVGRFVWKFINKSTSEQMANLREWLKWAVANAEEKLGSGTGQLKLRYVYDMFIDKFWYLAKAIPFETFSGLVDKALDELKEMIDTNPAAKEYIEGKEKES